MVPQMTSHLQLLILSSLAASSPLGLDDVFLSPRNQTVREGDGVVFQCVSGESSPPASITWIKDGQVVTRGSQIQGEFGGGHQKKTSGTLHLINVTLEDDGMYVCVTYNPSLNISAQSKAAKLTVHGVPGWLQIVQGPDNLTVATGTEVSMHCTVHGFPVPMVHWFKNGCHLTKCSTSFSLRNNGQLLTFRDVAKEDEGFYYCEASNQRDRVQSKPAFLLIAEMDWSFVQQPKDLTVRTGENVTVTCRPPHSRPAAQVSWFKDNQLLTLTANVTVLPNGDLFLYSIQESDSGSYFCRASNLHLHRFLTSNRATLTVLAPPAVNLRPQQLTVPAGARVVLVCRVSGQPLPSIRWIKTGLSMQTGGRVSIGLRNATLHIQSARSYDEGMYTCQASNPLGESHGAAILRVAVSPIIDNFVTHMDCMIGASVTLPCRAVGILPITYTWSRGGAERNASINVNGNRRVEENGSLHITSVQWSDGGEYHCTAENSAGRHQRRTILTVTAEDDVADRRKRTSPVVSPSIATNKDMSVSNDLLNGPHLTTTTNPDTQSEHWSCSSSVCHFTTQRVSTTSSFLKRAVAELKMPQLSFLHPAQNQGLPLTTRSSQQFLTQIPHPFIVPPVPSKSQSVDANVQTHGNAPPSLISDKGSSTTTESVTEATTSEPVDRMWSVFKLDSYFRSPTQSLTSLPSHLAQTEPHDLLTTSQLYQPSYDQTITMSYPTHLSPPTTPSETLQTHHKQPPLNLSPNLNLEYLTTHSDLLSTHPPPSSVTTPYIHFNIQDQALPVDPTSSIPAQTSAPQLPFSISTLQPSEPLRLEPEVLVVPKVNQSDPDRLNGTEQSDPVHSTKSENATEISELLKRNTSQSPMTSNDPRVTHESPPWLPVVEEHDIPIVVGVGVSLAFIFISVTFYSVVQKNEPVPTNRAAQRNLGVPKRQAEGRAAGRTYENRAFEDDDCVAVIEQSPYTSDTRARPPGPSLVTVQIAPPHGLQEDTASLNNRSITVETYPEPILDTKIDPCLEEEKGCTMSQPNIQLQCAEDWVSNRDNNSACQDHLPPPSSLPSPSESPSSSPPSRREEGVHSSLTLQSPEQWVTPVQHSLSISHGNPPLLLSHHVSLGLTTVAVDVHFYPSATAAMTVGTSTQVNSVTNSTSVTAPVFSPPSVNSQDNDQLSARFPQSK